MEMKEEKKKAMKMENRRGRDEGSRGFLLIQFWKEKITYHCWAQLVVFFFFEEEDLLLMSLAGCSELQIHAQIGRSEHQVCYSLDNIVSFSFVFFLGEGDQSESLWDFGSFKSGSELVVKIKLDRVKLTTCRPINAPY